MMLQTSLMLFNYVFMKLTKLELCDINDEQAQAMEQGLDNIDRIIIRRSKLTSIGFQAIANAIGNRKFQVKTNYSFGYFNFN